MPTPRGTGAKKRLPATANALYAAVPQTANGAFTSQALNFRITNLWPNVISINIDFYTFLQEYIMLYNYDFFDELRENMYINAVPLHELNKEPPSDEIKIDSSWRIISADENPTISFAAGDLRDFFKYRCKSKVNIVKSVKAGKNIVLSQDETLMDGKSESYRLEIMPQQIIVSGADPAGIMYGVFRLEEMMKFNHAPIVKTGNYQSSPMLKTRISRSPMSFFQGNELDYLQSAYTDNYLQKMAHYHINGIWLHVYLRDLVKTDVFPGLGSKAAHYTRIIKELTRRAAKYAIKVYIYCQEPMGLHKGSAFWENHKDIQGHFSDGHDSFAMCTSTQKVKDFLFAGVKQLFTELPELGGLIVISASEFNSHCVTRLDTNCGRCKNRDRAEIIAEVLNLINAGAKAARPDAEIIAWNWSWAELQPQIIKLLDKSISLVADYERGGKRCFDGIEHILDEYSLSYVGPSERFMAVAEQAGNNRRMYAKLQLGVTHEIATVPYFPVMQKIVRKFFNMRKLGIEGMIECWNFGNILSRNIEVAGLLSFENDFDDPDEILMMLATRDFGKAAAGDFVAGWQKFCDATDHYPFQIPLLYSGSINYGGAYPLIFEKLNKKPPSSWHLFGEIKYQQHWPKLNSEWGDNIDHLCQEFGRDCTIDSFRTMTHEWGKGVQIMRNALAKVPGHLKKNAENEINICTAIHSQFLSTYHFLHFINLRDILLETEDPEHQRALLYKLRKIALNEITNALVLKKCAAGDNRLGFHGEAFGYFYNAEKIDKKIIITSESIGQIESRLSKK